MNLNGKKEYLLANYWELYSKDSYVKSLWLKESDKGPNYYRTETLDSAYQIAILDTYNELMNILVDEDTELHDKVLQITEFANRYVKNACEISFKEYYIPSIDELNV